MLYYVAWLIYWAGLAFLIAMVKENQKPTFYSK